MPDIYEQLQTEADVEAEKIRPTKEESSLYGAKWLTVEELLTDDTGYQQFAVDSAKAGGRGYPTVTVTIKNETDTSANVTLYGWDQDANNYILYAIFNDNNIKYFQKAIELDPNETVMVNSELVGTSFFISLSTTATGTGDVVIEFDESWEMYKATVTGNCEITLVRA